MFGVKKYQFLIVLFFLFGTAIARGQSVKVIKSAELFEMIDQCNDKVSIQVYNFWATWCAPCIRELPHFESINNSLGNVDVTLISIDDIDLLENKVKPFLQKKNIKSKVALLNETDFNEIIPGIDKNWSGAIPATLIIDCRNGKQLFFEKEFKEGELKETINKIINHSN